MNDQAAALRSPDDAFLRRLESHHRWSNPERYPSQPGDDPAVQLVAKDLDLARVDFSAMDLADISWVESNLAGSSFHDAWMPGTWAYKTSWRDCDLSGIQIAKSEAGLCDFSRANFHGAHLLRFELDNCDLRHADLSGSELTMFGLYECDARWLAVRDALLNGLWFDDAHVAGLDLTGCTGTVAGSVPLRRPRINIGDPEAPEWLEAEEALDWLRSRGAPTLTFFGAPSRPPF